MDYVMGFFLLVAPNVLALYPSEQVQWVPKHFGVVLLFLAFTSRTELGLFKLIAMRPHLMIDYVLGLALAVSPWVLGFYKHTWAPHLICGLLIFALALLTKKESNTVYADPA
jgi:hypothetical protein